MPRAVVVDASVAVEYLLRTAVGEAIGAWLAWVQGPALLLFGLAGAFSAYFYTAPPLRLCARRGFGELLVGLNFGPLMVGGTVFALTGTVTLR